jgi:hypothetical protein
MGIPIDSDHDSGLLKERSFVRRSVLGQTKKNSA